VADTVESVDTVDTVESAVPRTAVGSLLTCAAQVVDEALTGTAMDLTVPDDLEAPSN
jgi:hypothetical protein